MKEKTRKEKEPVASAHIATFIEEMKVNRMYELPVNADFKWAMIEHNEFGYCWTIGYKGICTNTYSTDPINNIKYWTTEAEAKGNLIEKFVQAETE